MMKLGTLFLRWLTVIPLVGNMACAAGERPSAASEPPQVPLCMVGDSITWAEEGDYWRKFLLERLSTLAFVGTHTGVLGYSHAGEGGNGTQAVLNRMAAIPDCPYYALLIGTNDNNVATADAVDSTARGTADRIVAIVQGLLAKPHARRVFLGSVLPCHTDNPLRDATNARTNAFLRDRLALFPAGKVVYVDYETPIRATPNWEPMIRLHPTQEGYRLLAKVLAEAIAAETGIAAGTAAPRALPGCGVRVANLFDERSCGTRAPVIAGWYTLSLEIGEITGPKPTVTLAGPVALGQPEFRQEFAVAPDGVGKRVALNFFTGYEGYGYTGCVLSLKASDCQVKRVLLEKTRPAMKPSVYGVGSYLDTVSPPQPGELIERP